METVTKSWVVVGTDKKKKKVVQLSRHYHVKGAADQYADLCQRAGIKDAEVKAIHGVEPKV
jgi:hypothetical protein